MYSIAWTRYTNFPRSAERGNSRPTRWRHRFYGEPGNNNDWRRGYWTMVQIRADDEQVLTTQSTTCISQLMMMTKIFQRRSYDGLNSMTLKNRHWYDVTWWLRNWSCDNNRFKIINHRASDFKDCIPYQDHLKQSHSVSTMIRPSDIPKGVWLREHSSAGLDNRWA